MSLINLAPSLPLKFDGVTTQTNPTRFELRAKPTGILGFLVSVLGAGEDARLLANETSCVLEQRTLFGRRRVCFPTSSLEGVILARGTGLAKVLAAFVLAIPLTLVILGAVLGGGRVNVGEVLLPVLFFGLPLILVILRPLKAEFGVLSSGVFHGLAVQFKSADLPKLEKSAVVLETLLTGERGGDPFDFAPPSAGFAAPEDDLFGDAFDPPEEDFDFEDSPADPPAFEPPPPPQPQKPKGYVHPCPNCGQKLRSKAPLAGKRVRCPGCKQEVTL